MTNRAPPTTKMKPPAKKPPFFHGLEFTNRAVAEGLASGVDVSCCDDEGTDPPPSGAVVGCVADAGASAAVDSGVSMAAVVVSGNATDGSLVGGAAVVVSWAGAVVV